MFQRAISHKPQTTPAAAGPSYAPVRFLQPKLTVGPVDDPFEREADRVAERVVSRLPAGSLLAAPALPPAVQRKEAEEGEPEEKDREEEDGEMVRLKAASAPPATPGPGVSPAVEAGIRQSGGTGRPLPAPVRSAMESAFGADFRLVRVHADSRADHLNRSLGARAFTTGRDLFFRGGEYRPDSAAGRRLLAHELTHVVQQGRGGGAAGWGIVQREVCYVSGVPGPYEGRVAERGVTIKPKGTYNPDQRSDILTRNNATRATVNIQLANSRFYNSDENDGPLLTKDLLSHHLAEIDHIYPEAKGGGNSVRNAQVLSQHENGGVKSDTYPWRNTRTNVQYAGTRVLLPEGTAPWNVARGGVLAVVGAGANADVRLPAGSTIPQGGVLHRAGAALPANTRLETWMTLPVGFPLENRAGDQLPVGVVLAQGRRLAADITLPLGFVPFENITLPLNAEQTRITPAPMGPFGPLGLPQINVSAAAGQVLPAGQALQAIYRLPGGAVLASALTLPAGFIAPFDLPLQLSSATSPSVPIVLQNPVNTPGDVTAAQSRNVLGAYDLKLSAARANGLAPAAYNPL